MAEPVPACTLWKRLRQESFVVFRSDASNNHLMTRTRLDSQPVKLDRLRPLRLAESNRNVNGDSTRTSLGVLNLAISALEGVSQTRVVSADRFHCLSFLVEASGQNPHTIRRGNDGLSFVARAVLEEGKPGKSHDCWC